MNLMTQNPSISKLECYSFPADGIKSPPEKRDSFGSFIDPCL